MSDVANLLEQRFEGDEIPISYILSKPSLQSVAKMPSASVLQQLDTETGRPKPWSGHYEPNDDDKAAEERERELMRQVQEAYAQVFASVENNKPKVDQVKSTQETQQIKEPIILEEDTSLNSEQDQLQT